MTQGYAIKLYFDDFLENQILAARKVLARKQISINLIELYQRPYITLFFSSSPSLLEPSELKTLLKTFASKNQPLSLSFSSIGFIPKPNDDNVLFFPPTPSVSLLRFQSELCDAMKKEGIEIDKEYCLGSWIPYCSVQLKIPKAKMAEAFCVLKDLKMVVTGSAVEFSPVVKVFSFVLGNENNVKKR